MQMNYVYLEKGQPAAFVCSLVVLVARPSEKTIQYLDNSVR